MIIELNKHTNSQQPFCKSWGSCFYKSEVLNLSFVLIMKFSAENRRLRKAAKRGTNHNVLVFDNQLYNLFS